MNTNKLVLLVCCVLLAAGVAEADVFFLGLGDLPGGRVSSKANAVSADGSVVVGESFSEFGSEAFRWENRIMIGLGDFPGGDFLSEARAVSANGLVIVGDGRGDENRQLTFRYADGVLVDLGEFPPNVFSTRPIGVSGDGLVVVGNASVFTGFDERPAGSRAFRWDDGSITFMDLPEDAIGSSARSVSADGLIVVGSVTIGQYRNGELIATHSEAIRWENGVTTLFGGESGDSTTTMSPDGSVIAGRSESGATFRLQDGARTILETTPSGANFHPLSMSADGSIIVGRGPGNNGQGEAIYWSENLGTIRFEDFLQTRGVIGAEGWVLYNVSGVSADGTVFVGHGLNPDGTGGGWMTRPIRPGDLSDLNRNGFVDFEDLTILLANWNKPDATVYEGNLVLPETSSVDFTDLTLLLSEWTGPGPAGSPEAALSEAVPEPSTLTLALVMVFGLTSCRLRCRPDRPGIWLK